MRNKIIKYTEGTGNIYQDLGFADFEERLAKARLAMYIEKIIKRNLKQSEGAEILEINESKISALTNGRLSEFSMERLIHFLNLLNQDVKIVKAKHTRSTNHGRSCFRLSEIK